MPRRKLKLSVCVLVGLCALSWSVIRGEKLPFKPYTTAEGLAHDNVNSIVRDPRGFLWICTSDGLSRFNGYEFKNYTQEHGLPHRSVNDLLITHDGSYLLATNAGLVEFDPLGKAFHWDVLAGRLDRTGNEPAMFRTFVPPDEPGNRISRAVLSLAQQQNGQIYAGTNHGLYRIVKNGDERVYHRVHPEHFGEGNLVLNALRGDRHGGLWVAANRGLFYVSAHDTVEKLSEFGGNTLFEDSQGRVWVDSGGHDLGLRLYIFPSSYPVLAHTFTRRDGLATNGFSNVVAESASGRLFVSSTGKLLEFLTDAKPGEPKFKPHDTDIIRAGATDSAGNVWLGTLGRGALRLGLSGFVNYGEGDGLPAAPITALYANREGSIFGIGPDLAIRRFSVGKIEAAIPRGLIKRSWGGRYMDLQAPDGEWWVPSERGLLRYPAVKNFTDLAHTAPIKTYTTRDGLLSDSVFNLFEDSRGDLWFTNTDMSDSVQRWERSTGKVHRYTEAEGIRTANGGSVTYGEDAAGNVWLGFYYGGLARLRRGQVRAFTAAEGIPEGYINDLHTDARGRLWIATRNRGLFRVDQPDAEVPTFANISTTQGLSSNEANCVASDKFGRIYVGTGKGLARYEPETQRFKLYTQADGLPGNYISQCRTDRDGALWLAGVNTVSRFVPTVEPPSAAPPILIDAISVNGVSRRISELGVASVENLQLGSDQRQLQIGFFALGFSAGDTLRYQYKINDQDWTAPSTQRTVSMELAAGTYRFAVRAVTADGVSSETPAVVSFTIARPVWQRWWFVTLAVLFVAGAVFALERYRASKTRQLQRAREERIAELQRVRSRIATDLHDDIGSSLTQIAVYSELARQRESENGKAGEPLDMINHVADELVDTMSDIVWAINPTKDHLSDLTQRMRRFAANVLSAKDIDLEFRAPDAEKDLPLGANIRREVFLIFKETINNIVKHSEAKTATVEFRLEQHQLAIELRDDGQGFTLHPEAPSNGKSDWKRFRGGNGLLNMKKRAAELGGSYTVESVPGSGTTVTLVVPFEVDQTGEKIPT